MTPYETQLIQALSKPTRLLDAKSQAVSILSNAIRDIAYSDAYGSLAKMRTLSNAIAQLTGAPTGPRGVAHSMRPREVELPMFDGARG